MSLCSLILFSLLTLQNSSPPDRQLFSRVLAAPSVQEKLILIDELVKKHPESDLRDDAYLIAMGIYQTKGDAARTVDYGERAIKINSSALEALVVLSRQYAIERRNLNRAIQYARRAVELAGQGRGQEPPPGYQLNEWIQYLGQSKETATQTIKYIQGLTNAVLGRKKGPGNRQLLFY